MKILKLSLLNLNSLYGRHEIDFTAIPFTHSGLFAITGETGAGKTTLLDAITLALFGCVARECEPTELMSHGTVESHAEITFQVKGLAYRASWKIRRARQKADGKMQPVKRELAKLNGEILAEKVRDVDAQVIELIQLDFAQFTRSVLLAQGHFAKFLDSSKNDRAEILEKITGTEIYRSLSEAAYERHKLEKQRLDDLSRQIDPNRLLSAEQKSVLQAQLSELQIQIQALQARQKSLNEQIEVQRNQTRLQQRLQDLQQEQQHLNAAQTAFAAAQQRLQQHQKAVAFAPDLRHLQEKRGAWLALIQDLQNTQQARFATQIERHNTEQNLKVTQAYLSQAKQQQTQQTLLINRVIELDQALRQHTEELQQHQQKHLQNQQAVQHAQQQLNHTETQLAKLQQEVATVQAWLDEHQQEQQLALNLPWLEAALGNYQTQQQQYLDNVQRIEHVAQQQVQLQIQQATLQKSQQVIEIKVQNLKAEQQARLECEQAVLGDFSPEALEQALDSAKQYVQKMETLQKLAQIWQQLEATLEGEQTQLAAIAKQVAQQEHALAEAKQVLQHLEILLDKQRVLAQQAQLLKSLTQHRAALRAGEACPLCGSLEHPLVDNYQDHSEAAEQELKAQEQAVKAQQKQLEKHAELVAQAHTQQATVQEKVQHLQQQQAQVEQEFAQHIEKSAKFAVAITQAAELVDLVVASRQQCDALQQSYNSYKQLSQQRQVQQEDWLKIQQKQQDLRSELQTLAVKGEAGADKLQQLQVEQSKLQQQLEQQQTQLEQRLSAYGEGWQAKPQAWLQSLQNRWQAWQQQAQQLSSLTQQLQQTEKQHTKLDTELQQLKKVAHEASARVQAQVEKLQATQVQRQALFGDANPLQVQKQLQQAVDAAYTRQQAAQRDNDALGQRLEHLATQIHKQKTDYQQRLNELHATQHALQQQARQQGFADLAEARGALLVDAQVQAWQAQQQALHTRQVQLQQSLQDTQHALATSQQAATQTQTEADLEQAMAQLHEQRSDLDKGVWEISKQLQDDVELRRAHAEQTQKIEQQKRVLHSWLLLNDLIGSQKGDKFQTFAQSLTLQRLVQLANQHLQTLNPRYRIQQAKDFNNKPLELEIIDTYQADNTRSMNTLSGGERFLTSLALALGLSDLAAKNAEIHSLFIDEGFGTLDSQTLDMAVDTLENLHASGKLVGVISHVEALQERLGTQVRVLRQGGGRSRIQIS